MNTLEARRRLLGRNAYKRTTEGNPAIAQGSLARRYPGITMQGWTEQAQYDGNQLFDASVFDGMEKSGVSVSVKDGVITATGTSDTAIWIQSANMTEEDFKKFKSGNIYVKNYKTSDCNYEVGIYINNTTIKEGNSPYNIPDGYLETNPNNVYFFIDIQAGVELKGSIQPMIYQDGDGTWEPYTGGQPSPSPDYKQDVKNAGKYNEETQKYEYEMKLTGANLFNPVSNQKGYYTGTVGNAVLFDTNVGYSWLLELTDFTTGQYTISLDTDVNVRWRYYITDDNDVILALYEDSSANATHNYRTFELPDGAKKFYFSILEIDSADGATIMLNPGSEALPHEPYRTPQTVTLTSDRPLTKWDKLEKRKGQWGWVYKSAEKVLDGTEPYVTASGNYISDFSSNCYTVISDMVIDGKDNAFMNRLSNIDYSWTLADAIGFSKNLDQLHVRISNADLGTTGESSSSEVIAAMKAYVAQQYEEGNPFVFWYETAEETFAPLPESEQAAMNALYTFRPTTVLSNDCECDMTLTYKTKKSLEVTT